MGYPTLEQYNQAFQLHSKLLADPELASGVLATSGLGLPLAISGGFALTYTIRSGSKKFAARCFHRESKGLERRYDAVSRKLATLRSKNFVEFEFQSRGIHVDGASYPIVKMAWAEGVTLGEFLQANKANPLALDNLSSALAKLSQFLEKEKLAHGDLQSGNLMVSANGHMVQLIDYDGMYVEELKDLGSAELGHVNFQHPQRKILNPFAPTLDRFSFIALTVALKALRADKSLWDKTKSESDAIVFRVNDYLDPATSPVFAMLAAMPSLCIHANHFAAVCRSPMNKAPTLAEFWNGNNIPALNISLSGPPRSIANVPVARPGYVGAYVVLSANEYAACLRKVGDKVEVIGQVVEVKADHSRSGKPYIFINFGSWKGQIFKISIWSEGLAALKAHPDTSWVGKWISVVGLMEPPYVNNKLKYSHLSVNVTTAGQMSVISAQEATWRLAGPVKGPAPTFGTSSNQEAIDKIRGRSQTAGSPSSASVAASNSSTSPNQAAIDKIRAATRPAIPTRRPAAPAPPPAPPPAPAPAPAPAPRPPQYPAPKPTHSLVEKIFSWLFK